MRQIPALSAARCFAPPQGIAQWNYRYYRPVTALTLLADGALYGQEPIGFHLTVLLLHAGCAFAVWLLARRLLSVEGAILGASLFAVCPLHAEPVGWIAGRTDVLATLFAVLAAAVWLGDSGVSRGCGVAFSSATGEASGRSRRLGAASLLFLAALLSKESALALAPILIGAAWLGRRGGHALAATAIATVLPVLVYVGMRAGLNPAAMHEETPPAAWSVIGTALWSASYFLRRLALPFSGPPYRVLPPENLLPTLFSLGLLLGGAAVALNAWRKGRVDRLVTLLWAATSIVAASAAAAWNVSRTPVADRHLYMAAVGSCLLLAGLIAGRGNQSGRESNGASPGHSRKTPTTEASPAGPARPSSSGAARRIRVRLVAGWGLVVVFAGTSLSRARIYSSDMAFWSAAVEAEPSSGAAYINLGNALSQANDLAGAQKAYRRGISLGLGDGDLALALTDLGASLYLSGQMDESERLMRQAAGLPRADATVNFNLGAFLYQKGIARLRQRQGAEAQAAFAEGASFLERAVQQDSYHVKAWLLLGHCYASTGQRERARSPWRRVIEIDGAHGPIGREAASALDAAGLPRGSG